MRFLVKGCKDCPMKRVDKEGRVWCKSGQEMLLYGKGEGDPDYVSDFDVHPECPMIESRLTMILEPLTKNAITGNVAAWIGCRIETMSGMKGIVCGKFKDSKVLNLDFSKGPAMTQEDKDAVWYAVLPDGGGVKYVPETKIKELIKTVPRFNYNDMFEFYFGYSEDPDE